MQEEDVLLEIETKIEKEDYHKFLYLTTFKLKKSPLLILIFLHAFLAVLIAFSRDTFSFSFLIIMLLVMIIFVLSILIFKLEYLYKKRIKTDKTGAFGSKAILNFFSNYISIKSEYLQTTSKLNYNQIYKAIEIKEYYVIYFNHKSASIIRKKDIIESDQKILSKILTNKLNRNYKKVH